MLNDLIGPVLPPDATGEIGFSCVPATGDAANFCASQVFAGGLVAVGVNRELGGDCP
jgi:hypothetical protein